MFKLGDRVMCKDTNLTNTEDSFGTTTGMHKIISDNKYLEIAKIKKDINLLGFKGYLSWTFHEDDFSLASKLLTTIKNNKQAEMQEV